VEELSECMRQHHSKQDNVLPSPPKVQEQSSLPPAQYVQSTSSTATTRGPAERQH